MIYIGLGLCFIIIGLFAIILKKHPNKKKIIDVYGKLYDKKVDEKKLALFEGTFYLTCGILLCVLGVLDITKNSTGFYVVATILVICLVGSSLSRTKFLNLK